MTKTEILSKSQSLRKSGRLFQLHEMREGTMGYNTVAIPS